MARHALASPRAVVLMALVWGWLTPMPAPAATDSLSTHSWTHCLHRHAHRIQINPVLFQAILETESRRRPYAFGWTDRDGLRHSYYATSLHDARAMLRYLFRTQTNFDVGLGQLNSKNISRFVKQYRIQPEEFLDPCTNVSFSAKVLEEQVAIHGYTWEAIAGYNGSVTYIPLVWTNLCRIQTFTDCPAADASHPRASPPAPGEPLILTRRHGRASIRPIIHPTPSPTPTTTNLHTTPSPMSQESSMSIPPPVPRFSSFLDSPLFWDILRSGLIVFVLLIAAIVVLSIGIRIILWALSIIRTGIHELRRPHALQQQIHYRG